MEIINLKKTKLLIKEQQKPHENAKICYISRERFEDKHAKDNTYCKVRDHCHNPGEYRSATHSICNLMYSVLKETRIAFANGSKYHYHFIIKRASRRT